MAVPKADSQLLPFVTNFSSRITSAPTTYSLVAADATIISGVVGPYQTAMAAIASPGQKSEHLTSVKTQAKLAMLPIVREYYARVQANMTVPDANKRDLGIRVRKTTPTPLPAPSSSPALSVLSVSGWTVELRLRDATNAAKRGRPPGTAGASLFSYAGETPPAQTSAWKFEGNTGLTKIVTQLNPSLAAGTKVWFTAFWFNPAKMSGPACPPICTNVQGGGVQSEAA